MEGGCVASSWAGRGMCSFRARHDSIGHLITQLEAGGSLAGLMGDLSGVFGLFVHDRAQGGWQIFPIVRTGQRRATRVSELGLGIPASRTVHRVEVVILGRAS
jgi:hypothetical protein